MCTAARASGSPARASANATEPSAQASSTLAPSARKPAPTAAARGTASSCAAVGERMSEHEPASAQPQRSPSRSEAASADAASRRTPASPTPSTARASRASQAWPRRSASSAAWLAARDRRPSPDRSSAAASAAGRDRPRHGRHRRVRFAHPRAGRGLAQPAIEQQAEPGRAVALEAVQRAVRTRRRRGITQRRGAHDAGESWPAGASGSRKRTSVWRSRRARSAPVGVPNATSASL